MAETEPTTHVPHSEMPGDPAWDDIAARWMASDLQRATAAAVLAAMPPEYQVCYVPIALVGKTRHWWDPDAITVEHVHAYFPSLNHGRQVPEPRALAEDAAYEALDGRPGTTSYAVVWRGGDDNDGPTAVFEGMRHIEPAPPGSTTIHVDEVGEPTTAKGCDG